MFNWLRKIAAGPQRVGEPAFRPAKLPPRRDQPAGVEPAPVPRVQRSTAPPPPRENVTLAKVSYLFPADQIQNLPSWRFVLHFKAPVESRDEKVRQALERLKTVEWTIIRIAGDLDSLRVDGRKDTLGIPIEVTEERRKRPNALAEYESDFWKICGNVMEFGFGDLYYEAIDWRGRR